MKKIKNLLKKIISCVCVTSLIMIPYCANAFASSPSSSQNQMSFSEVQEFEKMTNDELKEYMLSHGYTETEANNVMDAIEIQNSQRMNQLHNPRSFSNSRVTLSSSNGGFPDNPYDGQRCQMTYYLDADNIHSVADLSLKMIQAGVPGIIAVAIAAGVYAQGFTSPSTTGAWITVDYLYGITNDGYEGWTPGYCSWGLY